MSRACVSPNYFSIETMSVYRTVSELFSIKEWHNLETSIVHSKLDYCNSLYHNLPNYQLNRLQQIQNSLAHVAVKAAILTYHSHYQISPLA